MFGRIHTVKAIDMENGLLGIALGVSYLFEELAVQIINTLHTKTEFIIKEDRIGFDIRTKLPLLLFVLSRVWELCDNREYVKDHLGLTDYGGVAIVPELQDYIDTWRWNNLHLKK